MNNFLYFVNRKAFTLIELLAVIILIGIIAVIAVPKVSHTIIDSKNNINKSSVAGLVRVADAYYLEQKLENGFLGCSYNFTTGINTCSGLEFSGEKPSTGELEINSNGGVSIYAKYDNKCYVKNIFSNSISVKPYDEQTCKFISMTAYELDYTTVYNSNVTNVEEALDDLYRMVGN